MKTITKIDFLMGGKEGKNQNFKLEEIQFAIDLLKCNLYGESKQYELKKIDGKYNIVTERLVAVNDVDKVKEVRAKCIVCGTTVYSRLENKCKLCRVREANERRKAERRLV